MAIDKPSLAALLAQNRKAQANGDEAKESTRPFLLKDPRSIVKELMKKKAPQQVPDEDEEYLKSLLSKGDEPEEEFVFAEPTKEPEDVKSLLKRIMEGK